MIKRDRFFISIGSEGLLKKKKKNCSLGFTLKKMQDLCITNACNTHTHTQSTGDLHEFVKINVLVWVKSQYPCPAPTMLVGLGNKNETTHNAAK